jgi:hypothetical protein
MARGERMSSVGNALIKFLSKADVSAVYSFGRSWQRVRGAGRCVYTQNLAPGVKGKATQREVAREWREGPQEG